MFTPIIVQTSRERIIRKDMTSFCDLKLQVRTQNPRGLCETAPLSGLPCYCVKPAYIDTRKKYDFFLVMGFLSPAVRPKRIPGLLTIPLPPCARAHGRWEFPRHLESPQRRNPIWHGFVLGLLQSSHALALDRLSFFNIYNPIEVRMNDLLVGHFSTGYLVMPSTYWHYSNLISWRPSRLRHSMSLRNSVELVRTKITLKNAKKILASTHC